MKRTSSLVRLMRLPVLLIALLSAACAPIPLYPPHVPAPTSGVFVPGVNTSPLQPTSVTTAIESPIATDAVPSIAVLPSTTAAPGVAGRVWEWVSSTFKDGTVLAPDDPARYSVELLADGNALVQADCNFGTSSYQESGATLRFGAVGTTKMACPPDSLDSAFLAQLPNVASYAFKEGELVLTLKDGAGTMRLRVTGPASPPVQPPTPILLGTPVPVSTVIITATVLPVARGDDP